MLRRCEGYFLAEMLLSLAAFIMAVTIMLPIAIHVISQTIELRRAAEADHILFDELMYIKIMGTDSGRATISQNGTSYRLDVYQGDGMSSWEVCIYYEGMQQQTYKKCSLSE